MNVTSWTQGSPHSSHIDATDKGVWLLSMLIAEQTKCEMRAGVRSQFDHHGQFHWIVDIHPGGITFSGVLQWCHRHATKGYETDGISISLYPFIINMINFVEDINRSLWK